MPTVPEVRDPQQRAWEAPSLTMLVIGASEKDFLTDEYTTHYQNGFFGPS